MAIPGVDVNLVHKLFTSLDTLKSILTERVTGIIEQGTAAGGQGQDALQSILDDFRNHHNQALDLTSQITGVKPPTRK